MKEKILIVDDQQTNRVMLHNMLKDSYDIMEAAGGVEAINALFSQPDEIALVLLDLIMPEMDGFEVLSIMRSNAATNKIPVIFITADTESEIKGLHAGAVDYIHKPFEPRVVELRVSNQVELARYRKGLEAEVNNRIVELMETKEQILETLATIIEYRNLESGQHVKRTSILTEIMVEHMLKMSRYCETLHDLDYTYMIKAVPLHDLGKIGIPDNILLKPGRLTPAEFEVIKTHTVIGGKIISLIEKDDDPYLMHCREICLYHHERWNGEGYPKGIRGQEIPLSARIVSIVDVYDALVSERVYKEAFSHEEAVRIIQESAGTQFDPNLVQCFLKVQREFQQVKL